MKVLLIPDKFKGSLDAKEVIRAISEGVCQVHPGAEIFSVLASDGGDGFLNAVSENLNCTTTTVVTVDPLNRKMEAVYLFDNVTKTAYIELAKASGLELLKGAERDVMRTSSYGTGLQIRHAIENGATKIYLGLGGSATNDGGTGIAKALGYRFLDDLGHELEPVGGELSKIAKIEKKDVALDVTGISFHAVNDVNNPLYGKQGAAYVYAEQKGATSKEIQKLDKGLRHLEAIVKDQLKKNAAQLPGAGAAGGTAYGLNVFLNAEFISGIDFVLRLAKVNQLLSDHHFEYIITGEGKFDEQTLHGKLIKGVIDLGRQYQIPVIAICGQSDIDSAQSKSIGLEVILEIRDTAKSVQYSMDNAARLIRESIFSFFKSTLKK
ncbi:glycerate kinase [Pricia sp.]|uniref:glycerate kinase n=1 Tax=Pricia sp. TaxID=2268138 RepID=UPI00359414F9